MFKKHLTAKHSIMSTSSELDKLERTHKSELRMLSIAAFKFRSKFIRVEDPRRWQGETEACNVRMYETHFPGFCYLKDGKYRKKVLNNIQIKSADPLESSEKIKALLFTDNELDVQKVMCLHLLGTHVQSRRHVQRYSGGGPKERSRHKGDWLSVMSEWIQRVNAGKMKDGRPCSYVKSQTQGNKRHTLRSVSQWSSAYDKEMTSTYDRMLPRYVLEARVVDRNFSSSSIHTFDVDSCSDEESVKRRRFQVPVYINNDIRAIVSSVLEALELVNSPKLKELLSLARDPEQLRTLLSREDAQEFLIELAGNQLVSRATGYDFTLTHPVFDKIPGIGTSETVAEVLEINADSGLRNVLQLVRKVIGRRYEELVMCNVLPGKKKRPEGSKAGSATWNFSRTSFMSGEQSTKTCSSEDGSFSQFEPWSEKTSRSSLGRRGGKPSKEVGSQSLKSLFQHHNASEHSKSFLTLCDNRRDGNSMSFVSSSDSKNDGDLQCGRYQDGEVKKYDMKSLTNSQRILLGLKVASLKSKPVNMHQFENRKKVDFGALVSSILRPIMSDSSCEAFAQDEPFGLESKGSKRPVSRMSACQVEGLSNLSRGVLSTFRHDIATIENKKRVQEFMNSNV